MPPAVEIARTVIPHPMEDVAEKAGLQSGEYELYGRSKAKITPAAWERVANNEDGKLILMTAMTATRFGEGKTLTSIGLAQAFGQLGVNHILALRQPSLGPTLGMKGGAAGGGYSQLVPMEDINLHCTGDFHAITAAHNLLAACTDNIVHHGNRLGIDRIIFPRVMDLCDRQLRQVELGLGSKADGFPHRSGFLITAASEVMACMSLASDMEDLEQRLGRIIVAWSEENKPVHAREVGCIGAMMALLRDAFRPNLLQTLEGTPTFLHCGPFGNIAHGCNSVVATRLALKLADYVITEAGFAADLGAEKFLHIKCRQTGLRPSVAVLVVSCRALRAHGGEDGQDWSQPNIKALRAGLPNAKVHIENLRKFGLPVVVCANRFHHDSLEELEVLEEFAREMDAPFAVSEAAALGGEGAITLANTILELAANNPPPDIRYLYNVNQPIVEKIETLAQEIYRADGVDIDPSALESIARIEANGLAGLPLCVAKTQLSISDNSKLAGAPTGWRLRVRDVTVSNGAGFLVVLAGKMLLMPGMPEHGAFEQIGLNPSGRIEGLF
ncbi:MAG: formate--tetrahydrofolate ligase [Candidatus Sumerlaeia bacterium]|nr:formate--tetrahydrofolate ligase [Candidatus Sumerlaeia bacterium]